MICTTGFRVGKTQRWHGRLSSAIPIKRRPWVHSQDGAECCSWSLRAIDHRMELVWKNSLIKFKRDIYRCTTDWREQKSDFRSVGYDP
jgi:hypothetical protein